ncbi:unnamed protein product [Brassicogethes aeneus]|uniref:Uncharacterized protein n=1 Tax=Brassicogethes aeneus TaxID=1431903 RepID=A0A9P0FKN0_BRAAE|nr:unnamed protein product [Brassicogethes aeneus]
MITTLISLLFLLAVIMPFNKYKNYIYVIGEFVKETLETGQKAIDIVPIKWTDAIPGNSEECETLYPPPPYDDGVFKKLINLIKNNEDADLEYSMYRIKIRAFARNYKEAKMKLGVVMKQSSAFSTGSEMDTDQKAKAASEILRTIKVPNKKITFYNELQPFSDKDIKTSGSSNDYSDENLKTKQKKTKSFARKKGHDKENQIDSSDDQSENFFKSLKKKRKHEISFDERGKDILKPSTLAKPSEKDLVRQQVLTNLQPLQIPKAKIHNAFQRGPAEQPRNKLFIENLITKYSKLMDDKGGENISKKDYLALMFQGVNNIVEYHVSDVKQDCNDIVELVNKKGLSAKIANNIILNPHMLAKKYDLNLPIQTVPEFTAFCELLLTKKEFSEDFVS